MLAYKKNRAQQRRKVLDEIKLERGCVDCGYNKHPAALDFDHVRGSKRIGVGAMLHYSIERIEEEIAKCEVRCANCHRIKTWG